MITGGKPALIPTHLPWTSSKVIHITLCICTFCDYSKTSVVTMVCRAKLQEIKEGIDSFMVYDLGLVPYMNKVHVTVYRGRVLFLNEI
jgi:hypothetical protein